MTHDGKVTFQNQLYEVGSSYRGQTVCLVREGQTLTVYLEDDRIASYPISEWDKIFSDDVIATAILDRNLHHSHIVNIRGKSYRLKEKMISGLWEGTPHKNTGETSQF